MKIIKTNAKNESQWTERMVEASVKKYSSLTVEAGKVFCPLTNSMSSTINCELCQFCKGVDFNVATSMESIRCAHKESANVKTARKDEVERLYVSEDVNKKESDITPDDLKSIFARSTQKFEDIEDSELMNGNRIVSAKNINESESDGTSNFVPKFSNSIFNSENIAQLIASQKEKEEADAEKAQEIQAQSEADRKSWETDTKEALDDIGYEHKSKIMSISHEAEASNPDISEYKFSIFDGGLKEKLDAIPELTDGEKLKSQADERRQNISRAKAEDNWESDAQKSVSTSQIVKDFFDNMLGE